MSIGIWQVVLILVIVLILFGAGKLPKVMGDVAAGVKNFKKGMKDDETDEPATRSLSESARGEEVTIERPVTVKDEAAKSS
jgi:sec-independent protein translocase protein TatA